MDRFRSAVVASLVSVSGLLLCGPAPRGSTCTPGTRSGLGKAFLAQCFK